MTTPPIEPGQRRRTFWSDFRRFFLRGLSGVVPPLVTIAILLWAYNFIDRNIGQYVTEGLLRVMASGTGKPALVSEADAYVYGTPLDEFDEQGRRVTREIRLLLKAGVPQSAKNRVWWELLFRKYHLSVVGFVLGILLIYFLGYFLASFIGHSIWRLMERTFSRVPLLKAVYPHVKQVTELFLSEKTLDVASVVAVEFGRAGSWAVGFIVGPGLPELRARLQGDFITVFVPASPTPFTGYALTVRRDEVVKLDMTLDEAMRFVVSCGVVVPGSHPYLKLETKSPWRAKDSAGATTESNEPTLKV
jgi:uncharacterized membrane protein